jgi:hypothetical protein
MMHTQQRRRLVVLGMMGQVPFAGMAWQVLHYLEGFRRLGHDVTYIEDTQDWPYDPERGEKTADCEYTIKHIAGLMAWSGMPHSWAYRAEARGGALFGLTEREVARRLERADALINLHGITELRDTYLEVPVRIYLETDPVWPQIAIAKGERRIIDVLDAHTHHFTFAENLGAPDCGVPDVRYRYVPTRQPIVLDWWTPTGKRTETSVNRFTTIANWRQTGRDIEWNGETLTWSKDVQFRQFLDLPHRSGQPFEIALSGDADAWQLLACHGWTVSDAVALSIESLHYRDYILGSRGEFTVAKDQYTRLRSGWFSDRSACYLAGGRPVITQDTAFGNVLPTGHGLFAFQTVEQVLAALDQINARYDEHSRAAREIAEEYFAAERVVGRLLKEVGL